MCSAHSAARLRPAERQLNIRPPAHGGLVVCILSWLCVDEHPVSNSSSSPMKTGDHRAMNYSSDSPSSPNQISPAPPGRRRRFSNDQKRAILAEATQENSSVSSVARKYAISPSLLFRWKNRHSGGESSSAGGGETRSPDARIATLQKKVDKLEVLLGKKTLEIETLRELLRATGSTVSDDLLNEL